MRLLKENKGEENIFDCGSGKVPKTWAIKGKRKNYNSSKSRTSAFKRHY
jgi:hypothetical protein